MLTSSRVLLSRASRRGLLLKSSPVLISSSNLSTTKQVFRGPSRYKSKRTKLSPDKRIQTPEELFHSASNVDIENLRKDVAERTELRYVQPNKVWISEVFPDLNLPESFSYYDDHSNRNFIKYHLVKNFGDISKSFIWKDLQYTEVSIGDIVDLSGNFEKSELAVVIELPKSPEDPRYTLLNAYGEIQFVSRSKMGLRLPKIFPKAWFKNCVMEEEKFWINADVSEIVPIGKPKYKLEDVIDRNKIFESAVARSITGENAAKTYILPSILSGLISEILTDMVIKAWQVLPDINIKLEVLHNVLQSNETPIQLTLYQLYNAVEITDLQVLIKDFSSQKPDDVNNAYKKLFDTVSNQLSIGNQYNSISLGKDIIGNVKLDLSVNPIKFYGFILSLRKNNQLYSHDSFSKASPYVLVLPLNRIVKFSNLVQDFKNNVDLYVDLAEYINYKLKDKDVDSKKFNYVKKHYNTFIELLKLYCAGSVQNSVLESFVIKIMRYIPSYRDLDITNSVVYDLLLNTKEIANAEGPSKWWDNAMIPFSGVSVKCDYEQSYFDSITKDNINDYIDLNYDVQLSKRKEFDDVIYCIDSENPLEIDDGVAIKKLNDDEFLVSTFVADPSSYFKPDSLVAKIAFERGLTLYLPDLSGTNAVSLLPTEFSQAIQLGDFSKETRTLKVTFKYNIKTKELSELSDDEVISFGVAKKFIKIDYASVNKVLSNDSSSDNILEIKSANSGIPIEQIRTDLKNLSIVSQCLNEAASSNGRVSLFDQINVKKEIENISENENKEIQLTFKDAYNDDTVKTQEAKSEQLVSEIMVISNHLTGSFCKNHGIPAIYKIQLPLEMSPEVQQFSKEILVKKDSSFKELTLYQEYLTKSTIAPFPAKHEFLNIDNYATVTSPLRRFWDLVNHWQLHSYVESGKPKFTQEQINYMALQLKYKDELNNKISNKVIGFYTFKALKYLQEVNNNGNKIKFKVCVTKKPSESGLIEVIMLDYGVRCILATSWYALNEKKPDIDIQSITKNLEIGDIIEDATIKDIDLLDGSILLTSESV
jgi:exoribonuclease II